MSRLSIALASGGLVAMAMILMSDMPCAHDVEKTVHHAKKALKEQL
jgi:hypothetical protein